jgi:hypothetical protein
VGARFRVMKARQNDLIEKNSENFFDSIFKLARRSWIDSLCARQAREKQRNRRAPAARDAKKPIFLDQNSRCE